MTSTRAVPAEWRDASPVMNPRRHGWEGQLNIAEIELSILTRECLGRRIPTPEALASEIAVYERRRNQAAEPIRWQFTNDKARIKLHRLYPSNPS